MIQVEGSSSISVSGIDSGGAVFVCELSSSVISSFLLSFLSSFFSEEAASSFLEEDEVSSFFSEDTVSPFEEDASAELSFLLLSVVSSFLTDEPFPFVSVLFVVFVAEDVLSDVDPPVGVVLSLLDEVTCVVCVAELLSVVWSAETSFVSDTASFFAELLSTASSGLLSDTTAFGSFSTLAGAASADLSDSLDSSGESGTADATALDTEAPVA